MEITVVFARFPMWFANLCASRCHLARHPVLVGVAIRAHNSKVMLSMLIKIFGGDAIAACCRLTR